MTMEDYDSKKTTLENQLKEALEDRNKCDIRRRAAEKAMKELDEEFIAAQRDAMRSAKRK